MCRARAAVLAAALALVLGDVASAADPIVLVTDAREVLARSNEDGLGGCGSLISDTETPTVAFSGFDASVSVGGASATQLSAVNPVQISASGTGIGQSLRCTNVYGRSRFEIAFQVDKALEISLSGQVSASEGTGSVVLLKDGAFVVGASANFQTIPFDFVEVLEPGDYTLTATGESWEGVGSFGFVADFATVDAVPALAPTAQLALAAALAGWGGRRLGRAAPAARRPGDLES